MEPSPSSSPIGSAAAVLPPTHGLNPVSEINARFDTQVEVRVYPCYSSSKSKGKEKKDCTKFTVKPEGAIIQSSSQSRGTNTTTDLEEKYGAKIGRKLVHYEVNDSRAFQLLVTTHGNSFWAVAAPEAFSRRSGICRLLGDKEHPPATHVLQVGDSLRLGSVGLIVIEIHNGIENRVLSEEKIQKIMKDTTTGIEEALEKSDDESAEDEKKEDKSIESGNGEEVSFDKENLDSGLHECKATEAGNQICLSSVDATCSLSKDPFKSGFKLKDGHHVKLFKSSLEPPYVSFLVATKHKVAQHLFKTRFQLSFSTILTQDGRNATRPLLIGRSPDSDIVLDYQTISARHASIRFKNGNFYFLDEGSSNGSYLHLRQPVELSSFQPVQFRLRKSILSLKVVDKWNTRFRADCYTGNTRDCEADSYGLNDHIGRSDIDIHMADKSGCTRESIMQSFPHAGHFDQSSRQHLDLLYTLAYPDCDKERITEVQGKEHKIAELEDEDCKVEHKIESEDSNVVLKIEEHETENSSVENMIEDLEGGDSNFDLKIEELGREDFNVDHKVEDLEGEDSKVDHEVEKLEGEDSKVDHEVEKLESKDCRVDEFDFVATSVIACDDVGSENCSWVYLQMK